MRGWCGWHAIGSSIGRAPGVPKAALPLRHRPQASRRQRAAGKNYCRTRKASPEAAYERGLLLERLRTALAELPQPQRDAFVAHEFEGESFSAMAARTGVGVSTLLARKRYAVLHLRRQLRALRDEFWTN